MKKPSCIILGAGGHAAVVIDCIQSSKLAHIVGMLDSDSSRWNQNVLGFPIVGNDELLPDLVKAGATHFAVGMGSTGDAQARRRLFNMGLAAGLKPLTVRHSSSVCSDAAILGEGVQCMPGSVINARASIGSNVIVNSGAIVEHDCVIGDHVHIASGAVLASTVCVEEGAHIGAGAVVKQCLRIGRGAVVGAGAVVVKDVEAEKVVVGVPARVMKS